MKSLLFQKILPNLAILSVICYLTLYMSKFTQNMINLIIYLDFGN